MIKARDLEPGMVLRIKGKAWTVVKAKTKGKVVRLTVSGAAGEFKSEVKAKAEYELLDRGERTGGKPGKDPKPPKGGPLYEPVPDHPGAQAMRRWAKPNEVVKAEHKAKPPKAPKIAPGDVGWDDDQSKADKRVRKILGGKLLAVETKPGQYVMPLVGPDTITGHLLTFHGLRFDGVSVDDARTPEAERTMDAQTAIDRASYLEAVRIHDEQHAAFERGDLELSTPHWHSAERPAA